MGKANVMSRICVEGLEARQFLSVSPLAKPAPLPSALGNFVGTATLKVIGSESVSIDITTQTTKGKISGTVDLIDSNQISGFNGTINKKGVVHITAKAPKFVGKVTGTLSGDTLSGKFSTASGKTHTSGIFSTSRITT
jgi:hypothetical protein